MGTPKELILNQLEDLATTVGKEVVNDLKEWVADGKHEAMKDLAVRALKLKAKALATNDPDERRELADDLEFTLARIQTKIETEKIVLSKTIAATVMSGLKTALSSFATVGGALVANLVQSAIKGAASGLGDAISDKLGDAFASD